MSNKPFEKHLIFLVADSNMEQTIRGLMARPQSLGIAYKITFDIFKHPRHDPGVFHEAHEYLRNQQDNYKYAIVIFDRIGCGRESTKSASELESEVEKRLHKVGWKDRCAAIVIDPELEIWVFARSPRVIDIIADGNGQLYRDVLGKAQKDSNGKPLDPKSVMEEILRRANIPRSSSLYGDLAKAVSLEECRDRAFGRLKQVLQGWFSNVEGVDE